VNRTADFHKDSIYYCFPEVGDLHHRYERRARCAMRPSPIVPRERFRATG
jgi:hypothetical protein